MSGLTSDAYIAALNGLLHDIGKPMVRLLMYRNWKKEEAVVEVVRDALEAGEITSAEERGVRERVDSVLEAIVSRSDARRRYAHDSAWEYLLKLFNLSLKPEIRNILENAVTIADRESAAERLDVSLQVARLNLAHHTSPFLSPFALLSILGFSTHDAVHVYVNDSGLKADKLRVKCKLLSSNSCKDSIRHGLQGLVQGNHTSVITEKLRSMPVWHPVRPIRWRSSPQEYYARSLSEAQQAVDYVSVNASLFAGLYRLLYAVESAAKCRVDFDVIEPLTALYRRALLFVPSAVYGGPQRIVLPEISLYAHSRVVAAFSAALYGSMRTCKRLCYRLLILDLMNIQRYITAHRVVSAAVRALRGRSLIVELAQRAAANYILARLGLPWSNVYTYEGGVVSIIVPCCKSLDSIIEELEDLFKQEFRGRLGVAAAYTRGVDFSPNKTYSRYRFDPQDPESFSWIVSNAALELAARKARVEVKPGSFGAHQPQELAYDPFTEETVDRSYYVSYSDIPDEKYWEHIAGKGEGIKLIEEAGGVSLDTHRALVAGTAAPNMAAIIEIYLHDCDNNKAREVFKRIADNLFGHPAKRYTSVRIGGTRCRLALVDLPSLRAGYVLVSLDQADAGQTPWSVITSVVQMLAESLRDSDNCRFRIVVTRVNVAEDFIPQPEYIDKMLDIVKGLNLELSFDWMALNTRYPVKQADGILSFKGLDETAKNGLVALIKMDSDNMGNVMFYMSSSPSRLATASEILSLVFGFLGYKLVESNNEVGEKIYIVYMGGDDAVFFGDLPAAVKLAQGLEELYVRMLPGMTISAGAAVEDVKLPLYLAYMEATRKLEEAKNEPTVLVGNERDDVRIVLQGTIIISQLTQPTMICTEPEPLELGILKWKGYVSLEKALDLAASNNIDGTRPYRILVELADALSKVAKYKNCALSGVEVARILIDYAYTRERVRELSKQDILPNLLERASGIKPNYPPQTSVGMPQARLELYLALLLSRNTLNTAYQLYRITSQSQT